MNHNQFHEALTRAIAQVNRGINSARHYRLAKWRTLRDDRASAGIEIDEQGQEQPTYDPLTTVEAEITMSDRSTRYVVYSCISESLAESDKAFSLSLDFGPFELPNELQRLYNVLRLAKSPVQLRLLREKLPPRIDIVGVEAGVVIASLCAPVLEHVLDNLRRSRDLIVANLERGEGDDYWEIDLP